MNLLKKIFQPTTVLWWLPTLAVIILFFPVLFGGDIFFNSVFIRKYDMPIHLWFGDAIRSGTWGINHFYLGGFPSYLSQNDLLHPLVLLMYRLLEPLRAYHGLLALAVVGQWYTFYALARTIPLSRTASVFAAFAWVFNQWNMQWGTLEAIGLYLVTVPLFFLAIIKVSRGKYWYGLIAALAVGPFWAMSLTQTTLYLFSVGGLFALFLDFTAHRYSLKKYRTTFAYILIVLLSVLIVAPLLSLGYQFSQLTWRQGGLHYQESINDYYNVFDLVHFFSPFIHFEHITTTYPHFFIGALPLFFFLLSWWIKSDNPYLKFFRWTAVVVFILAFQYSPLFYLVSRLPVFDMFRGPGKWLHLFNLPVALLAGFGIDYVRRVSSKELAHKASRIFTKVLVIISAVIFLVNGIFFITRDRLLEIGFRLFIRFGYSKTLQREPSYYIDKVRELMDSWFNSISLKNPDVLIVGGALVAAWLLVRQFVRDKLSFFWFSRLAVGLMIISSVLIWHRYFSFVSVKVLDPAETTRFLIDRRDELYRVSNFNIGIESYKKMGLDYLNPEKMYQFELATLLANEHIRYGIQLLDGYENLSTRRQQFIRDFVNQFTTQKIDLATKRTSFESPDYRRLLSMMNVKYVISTVELNFPFIKLLNSKIPGSSIPLAVYENPGVLPRFYFVASQNFIPQGLPDEMIQQELKKVPDFSRSALIECNNCNATPDRIGTVSIKSYLPGKVEVETNNATGSWLIFSESLLLGWHASIDDIATPIYPANYLFQAVRVPAGKHVIRFKYDLFKSEILFWK